MGRSQEVMDSQLRENGVNYIGERLYLEDMHPANVFIDPQSGKPICIDCIVKFIKKE